MAAKQVTSVIKVHWRSKTFIVNNLNWKSSGQTIQSPGARRLKTESETGEMGKIRICGLHYVWFVLNKIPIDTIRLCCERIQS